jgi:hypothetical protein
LKSLNNEKELQIEKLEKEMESIKNKNKIQEVVQD